MKNVKIPNYDNMLVKQENITTYVGKPNADKSSEDTSSEADGNGDISEKQSFVAPGPRYQPDSTDKNSGLIKKIGEFFK